MRLRAFRLAAWLGWQMESNWTDPWLFAVYSIIKPVSSALILVVMYYVVTGGQTQGDLFAGLYVGNAFFMYVGQLMFGMSWVVMEDREFFRTFKYMYLAAPSIYWYLTGRAVAKFLVTSLAVAVVLGFGTAFLDLPLALGAVRWGYLAAVLALGILACVAFGLLMAGIMVISARHGQGYAESFAGVLYLLCGVVFPLDVLPAPLQPVGRAIPFTYWIEGVRRALMGRGMSPSLAGVDDGAILAILLLSSLATLAVAVLFYAWMERIARDRGLIDQVTEH
nr:hypothetical protein [Bacillota bacterium]